MSRNKNHHSNVYFGSRLRIFRKHLRLNVEQFSGLLGISQSSLSAVENNKTKTSSQTIVNLVQNTDINIYWLFSGKGTMLREKDTNEAYSETSLDNDPEVAELLEGAKKVLKSGNKAAFDALQRNIRYFAHTIKVEERLVKIEQNMKHRMVAMEKK
jgi:transcriptional regulator with XRE-family HTH domain